MIDGEVWLVRRFSLPSETTGVFLFLKKSFHLDNCIFLRVMWSRESGE